MRDSRSAVVADEDDRDGGRGIAGGAFYFRLERCEERGADGEFVVVLDWGAGAVAGEIGCEDGGGGGQEGD